MAKLKGLDFIIVALIVAGALNIAIAGLLGFNIIGSILGMFHSDIASKITYGLIGGAAVIGIFKYLK